MIFFFKFLARVLFVLKDDRVVIEIVALLLSLLSILLECMLGDILNLLFLRLSFLSVKRDLMDCGILFLSHLHTNLDS